MDSSFRPLDGLLVVDLTRYLPGPFASRELLRRGARVVRLEAPAGDPLRALVPSWHDALNAGKESVVCDLKHDPEFGQALCARADVVLEGFRPGVAVRLGLDPATLPSSVIFCSLSGFGAQGEYALRPGHDLNYLGYAGALAETAPAIPPLPVADLAAGALMAVNEILLALYERARSGRGRRLEISMTHNLHRLLSYRIVGEDLPGLLTGRYACYRIYATADEQWLTVAAIEPSFFHTLCLRIGQGNLAPLQYDVDSQPRLMAAFTEVFASRPLSHWLTDLAEVAVGPVATLQEAAGMWGNQEATEDRSSLGEHTARWRAILSH